jgi:hypothetical protein
LHVHINFTFQRRFHEENSGVSLILKNVQNQTLQENHKNAFKTS